MWPKLLDIPKDQCVGLLRNLECQAYTVLVDAYRAGGVLTDEKKSSLENVAKLLNISTERHKAEVRRAVNDELLNTISTRLHGPDSDYTWTKEGRRIIPILPRALANTGFSSIANRAAEDICRKNSTLLRPSQTRSAPVAPSLPKPDHLLAPVPVSCPQVASLTSPPVVNNVAHHNGIKLETDVKPQPVSDSENGLVVLPSGTVVKVSSNAQTKPGRGKRRRSTSASKSIEVFPGGMAQLQASLRGESEGGSDKSPPRKLSSVVGAGHGYARPLPTNSPLPERQVVLPMDTVLTKRGPGRPPGPGSPQLVSGSAPVFHQVSTRGRPRMSRGRGAKSRGGVVITPRLATPQQVTSHPSGPQLAAPNSAPIIFPGSNLNTGTSMISQSQSTTLLPNAPIVTTARLALRPTTVTVAAPRATTIQLKQETANLPNPALQGLKVISHSTTKIVPKSATAVYVVPSVSRSSLAGSPQRIVTVNTLPNQTIAGHRVLTSGQLTPSLPGVIKTVRAGTGKPSVIVLQKGASLPSVSGGVALYRPARARVVSGTPTSASGPAANNVYVVDMSKTGHSNSVSAETRSLLSAPVSSKASTNSVDVSHQTNGDFSATLNNHHTVTSEKINNADAENNQLEKSMEHNHVKDVSKVAEGLNEKEEQEIIPTYDLSSEENITNVIESEVLEKKIVESNGPISQQ